MINGHIWQPGDRDGKLNTVPEREFDQVRLMSEFKKRNAERKGGKKQESRSRKLIEENLEDLRDISGEEK